MVLRGLWNRIKNLQYPPGLFHLHQPCSYSPTPCLQLDIEVVKVDGLAHPGVEDKAEEREAQDASKAEKPSDIKPSSNEAPEEETKKEGE